MVDLINKTPEQEAKQRHEEKEALKIAHKIEDEGHNLNQGQTPKQFYKKVINELEHIPTSEAAAVMWDLSSDARKSPAVKKEIDAFTTEAKKDMDSFRDSFRKVAEKHGVKHDPETQVTHHDEEHAKKIVDPAKGLPPVPHNPNKHR